MIKIYFTSLLLLLSSICLGQSKFTYDTAGNRVKRFVDPRPDLVLSMEMDNTEIKANKIHDFVVRIFEIRGVATTASTTFIVQEPASFNVTYPTADGIANVDGGVPHTNSEWTFTRSGRFIICTTANIIPAGGVKTICFRIAAKQVLAENTTQNITVNIQAGTGGGETPSTNNVAVTSVTFN